jgi:putative colanic acid biosynthesis acetyltransferase WcaF
MKPLDARHSRPLEGGPSFSLGDRLRRLLWHTAWFVLCRFTPPPLHAWRRLVLRACGAKVGLGARVHGSARIWLASHLDLGANALIGPHARIYNQGFIRIGAGSVVSQGAHLCASSHDLGDPHFQLVLKPITIGEGCWIAAEAFVGPGVVMGDGSVLAARAALFGAAEPGGVYSGNPAQFLKRRQLPA